MCISTFSDVLIVRARCGSLKTGGEKNVNLAMRSCSPGIFSRQCVVRVVPRRGEGTEFVSAWCEPVNQLLCPLAVLPPVRMIGGQGAD